MRSENRTLVKLVEVLLSKEAVDYDKELANLKAITQTTLKGLVDSYQRVIVDPESNNVSLLTSWE